MLLWILSILFSFSLDFLCLCVSPLLMQRELSVRYAETCFGFSAVMTDLDPCSEHPDLHSLSVHIMCLRGLAHSRPR